MIPDTDANIWDKDKDQKGKLVAYERDPWKGGGGLICVFGEHWTDAFVNISGGIMDCNFRSSLSIILLNNYVTSSLGLDNKMPDSLPPQE